MILEPTKARHLSFRYRRHYAARGQARAPTATARAARISSCVPVGTTVHEPRAGVLLGDLTVNGEHLEVARGGRAAAATRASPPPRTAPRAAPIPARRARRALRLELRLRRRGRRASRTRVSRPWSRPVGRAPEDRQTTVHPRADARGWSGSTRGGLHHRGRARVDPGRGRGELGSDSSGTSSGRGSSSISSTRPPRAATRWRTEDDPGGLGRTRPSRRGPGCREQDRPRGRRAA